MKRTISKRLHQWKNKKNRKPLILTGIRQCGKTYVLKEFGEEEFSHVAYFVFENNSRLCSVFESDFDTNRILGELEILYGASIHPGETLLIFDEIQACPKAITSLKYFCEEQSDLHVVAAGSLLGVELGKTRASFPVGKVERMDMYPMSFYEFLMATGYEKLLERLQEEFDGGEIKELYTEPLERELRNYYYVGGMPEVVASWVSNHSIEEVDELQNNLLDGYERDFSKYAPAKDVLKLRLLYGSVPQQLAKENNKFVFSHVKESYRAKDLEASLSWLFDAGLVYKLCKTEEASLPLTMYMDDSYYKIYMSDVGLLRCRTGIPYEELLNWRGKSAYSKFRGALTENFVMTELINEGFKPAFWRSGNSSEVDFLIEDKGRIIPIEAKAEISTKAQSYRVFCKKYKPDMGFRISMKNAGINQVEEVKTISLPLYMIWDIKHFL